jgi:hypothetical protein
VNISTTHACRVKSSTNVMKYLERPMLSTGNGPTKSECTSSKGLQVRGFCKGGGMMDRRRNGSGERWWTGMDENISHEK